MSIRLVQVGLRSVRLDHFYVAVADFLTGAQQVAIKLDIEQVVLRASDLLVEAWFDGTDDFDV